MGVKWRSGERGRGGRGEGGQAGGAAQKGSKLQLSLGPVDAGIVALEPGKSQHQLEMTQVGHLEGESFGMNPMDAHAGRKVVSDRTGGRDTAIDHL